MTPYSVVHNGFTLFIGYLANVWGMTGLGLVFVALLILGIALRSARRVLSIVFHIICGIVGVLLLIAALKTVGVPVDQLIVQMVDGIGYAINQFRQVTPQTP